MPDTVPLTPLQALWYAVLHTLLPSPSTPSGDAPKLRDVLRGMLTALIANAALAQFLHDWLPQVLAVLPMPWSMLALGLLHLFVIIVSQFVRNPTPPVGA